MNFVTPQGFRDVLTDEAALREQAARSVQELMAARGYAPVETPTLEVMDVLQSGGRIPGSPFKFFDAQGDLLAMRPDVTLQIARMCATRLKGQPGPFRFRYMQRVFREAEGQVQAAPRETTQMGVELIGDASAAADAEVLALFAESLQTVGVSKFTISLASVGVLRALLAASGAAQTWRDAVLEAYHASNYVDLDALTCDAGAKEGGARQDIAAAIAKLAAIRGGREAIASVRSLVSPLGCEDGLDSLEAVYDALQSEGLAGCIQIDFSVMSSFDYYTGMVFEAYAPGMGAALGSGGRYDTTMAAFGEDRPAAGFAFYLERALSAVEKQDIAEPAAFEHVCNDGVCTLVPVQRPLRIAVPKGSLNPDAIKCLAACGLDTTGLENPGRQLIIKNPGVEYIIVRPSDAPAFVELGAADCGICGEDSLLEANPDVVELADLKFGACRFIVAEPAGAAERTQEHYRRQGSIRVATKYPNITRAHYAKTGVQVEIVKLHGNIELAPLTGMAERIVDITATGTTLRENNLVIVEDVLSSTARFFANTCAFRTDARVVALAEKMRAGAAAGKWEATVIAGSTQAASAQ